MLPLYPIPLAPVRTIPATIAAELGEAQTRIALWGLIRIGLYFIHNYFGINMLVELVTNRNSPKKH
jgi:phosphate transport system permease protein